MPKIAYEEKNISPERMDKIRTANEIIAEYAKHNISLSLRSVYYQFVARGFIPNNEREYKKLGDIISDGRLAGLIDWNAIIDRTRYIRKVSTWESTSEIVGECADAFRYDIWENQPYYVEVWIEKDALLGVIEDVCDEYGVPYLACRGYASMSEIWRAGHTRIKSQKRYRKKIRILYLGDHDPSGIDMTRDVQERLTMFAGFPVQVERLALNMSQVEEHEPPPNPTKLTDSRALGYISQFGKECWELDALDPVTISDLVRDKLDEMIDIKKWTKTKTEEQQARNELRKIADTL